MKTASIWSQCRMNLLLPAIILAFTTSCSKDPAQPNASGAGPLATVPEESKKKQAELWTCPMHPQIKKDGPGTCPICGMNLVKADSTEADSPDAPSEQSSTPEGHAAFKLSNQRQQMIGVRIGEVQKKPLFKLIEAAGRVAFDPELYTAQSEYQEAIRQMERVKNSQLSDVRHSAERMVESAKLRLKVLGLSDRQIVSLGESSSTGSNLLVPKPGENLWIYAEVFEMDLPNIRPGLEAVISGGALGGKETLGKVASVDRVINPTTRTAKVRIQISNSKALLRPESYVDVAIKAPLGEQVTVPFDAILDTGKEAWVFVSQPGGRFEPRLINIRFRANDEVAIESGVQPGEKIVTSGNFLMDSESRLKGVLAGQTETSSTQSPSAEKSPVAPKTPECPKGQFWHAEMKHCMNKPGQ